MGLPRSFGYAINGIKLSLKQRNKKIQVACTFIAILLGFIFRISYGEWCAVLICTGLVLSLEMMNTALETLVDFVSPEHHEKAGKVKDIAAGSVLVAAVISAIVGVIIFGKYILNLFH
jgi:diacylglycerol kinase